MQPANASERATPTTTPSLRITRTGGGTKAGVAVRMISLALVALFLGGMFTSLWVPNAKAQVGDLVEDVTDTVNDPADAAAEDVPQIADDVHRIVAENVIGGSPATGDFSLAGTSALSLVAGASPVTWTFSFTLAGTNGWPAGGSYEVTFPMDGFPAETDAFIITGATAILEVNNVVEAGTSVSIEPPGTPRGTIRITRDTSAPALASGAVIEAIISGITNPASATSTGAFVARTSNEQGVPLDQGAHPAATLTPGVLAPVSVVPASLSVGATGAHTITVTLDNKWPGGAAAGTATPAAPGGKLVITYPAGFAFGAPAVTATTGASACAANLASYSGVGVNGQTLTVNRATGSTVATCAAGDTIVVILSGITNTGASGLTSPIAVEIQGRGGETIDRGSDTETIADLGTADLTSISPAPVSDDAGDTTTYTFSLVVPGGGLTAAWPADGSVRVTFPAAFQPGAVTLASPTISGCGGTGGTLGIPVVSGNTVTIPRSGTGISPCYAAGGGTVAFSLTNIKNPQVEGPYAITAFLQDGAPAPAGDIAGDTDSVVIVPHAFAAGPTITPVAASDFNAGKTGASYRFGISAFNSWPADGILRIVFPSQYAAGLGGGPFTATFNGAQCGTGTLTATVPGGSNTMTITRVGAGSTICAPGTTLSIDVGGIANPLTFGTTGTFDITTRTAGGVDRIDENAAVPGVLIVPKSLLTGVTVTPTSLTPAANNFIAGTTTKYKFDFTLANAATGGTGWPAGGVLSVRFPPGFVLDPLGTTDVDSAVPPGGCAVTYNPNVAVSGSPATGMLATITRTDIVNCAAAAGPFSITLDDIQNPPISGATSTFRIATMNAAGTTDLDGRQDSIVTLTPGLLTDTSRSPLNSPAGQTPVTYTFGFDVVNEWTDDGLVTLTFPNGYALGASAQPISVFGPVTGGTGCTGALLSTADKGTLAYVSGTTTTATFVRSGGAAIPFCTGTDVEMTISQVTNPAGSGATGIFGVTTKNSIGTAIDTTNAAANEIAAITIDPAGALASPSAAAVNDQAGATTEYLFTFTTATTWPANGKFQVTFPTISGLPTGTNGYQLGLAGAVAVVDASPACSGYGTPIVTQLTVTVVKTASCGAGTYFVKLGQITNPQIAITTTPTFRMVTQSATGVDLDVVNSATETIIARTLSTAAVTINNPPAAAGQTSQYKLDFTTLNPWPAAGILEVNLGPSYTSGLGSGLTALYNADTASGCNSGSLNPSSGGSVLTINRVSAAAACPAGSRVVIIVSNIQNPGASGPTGTLTHLKTFSGLDAIDEKLGLGTLTINPRGTLGISSLGPAPGESFVAGQPAQYKIDYTLPAGTTNPVGWPSTGKLVVVLPAGYNTIGTPVVVGESGCTGYGAVAPSGSFPNPITLTIPRSGATDCAPATAGSITLSNIRNPPVAGATGTFRVATQTATGVDLDANNLPNVIIQAGALTVGVPVITGLTDGSLAAGETTPYKIPLTLANEWPTSGGKVTITLPMGFTIPGGVTASLADVAGLGGANCADNTPTGGTLGLESVSTSTATFTRSGGDNLCTAATMNLILGTDGAALTQVTNPSNAQNTGVFSAVTKTASAVTIDSGSSSTGVTITPTANGDLLPSIDTAVTNLAAGATANYKIDFALPSGSTHDWPAGGKLVINFPTVTVPTGSTGYVLNSGGPVQVVGASGCDNSYGTPVVTSLTITIPHANPCLAGTGQAASITLSNIKNPQVTGTNTVRVATQTPAGVDIDDGEDATVVLTPGLLSTAAPQLSAIAPKKAGGTSTYTAAFTPINPWPADGRLVVVFPTDFPATLGSGPFTATYGAGACNSGTLIASVTSAQTMTLQRTGASGPCASAVSITFGPIANPNVAATTGMSSVTTTTNGLVPIDQRATSPGILIDPSSGTLGLDISMLTSSAAGAANQYEFDLTLASGSGTAGWPKDGKLVLTFPSGFVTSNPITFVGVDLIGGACGNNFGSVLTPITGGTPTITVTRGNDGVACAAGDHLAITLQTVTNPIVSGTPAAIRAATQTASGVDLDVATDTVTIVGGMLTDTSVAPTAPAPGAVETYTFGFDVANNWPDNGHVTVNFPNGFRLGVGGPVTAAFGAVTGGASCTGALLSTSDKGSLALLSNTLTSATFVRSGGTAIDFCPATDVEMTITQVTNPVTANTPGTNSGTFSLQTLTGGTPTLIDSGSGPAVVVTAPSLTGTGIDAETSIDPEATVLAAGAVTSYVFDFTTANTWPAGGKLEIVFPVVATPSGSTGYVLNSGGATAVVGSSGCDGSYGTPVVNGPTVTITRTNQCNAATSSSITLSNVRNPQVTGVTPVFRIATQDASATPVDVNAAYPTATIVANALPEAAVADSEGMAVAALLSDYLVSFDPLNPWPMDGRLQVTFPSGFPSGLGGGPFAASYATGTAGTCNSGTLTASGAGQVVTVSRVGAASVCSDDVVLLLENIRNPSTRGTTGTLTLTTTTGGLVPIDTDAAVAGIPVVGQGGDLSSTLQLLPASQIAGATTNYLVSFTTGTDSSSNWANTGKLFLDLPLDFTVPNGGMSILEVGGCLAGGTLSALGTDNGGATNILVTRTSGNACAPGSQVSLRIDGVTNPRVEGTSGAITATTRSPTNVDLDTGSSTVQIMLASLTFSAVTPTPATAGTASSYDFVITIPDQTPWPTDGKLSLTFPGTYTLAPSLTATFTSADTSCDTGGERGSLGATATGNLATITRSGGTGACDGEITLTISSGITNPAASGASGVFSALQRTASATGMASGTNPGTTIVPNGDPSTLTVVGIDPASPIAGATTTYTVGFTLPASPAWPADGRLAVNFPTGYVLPSTGTSIPVTDTSGCSGALGTLSASVASASQILVTRSASGMCASSAVQFTLGLIQNAPVSGAQTIGLMLRNAAGVDLLAGSDASPLALDPGALTVTITPVSNIAGAATSYDFTVATSNPIPVDGRIVVDFADTPGYVLGSVGVANVAGCNGLFAATKAGDVVSIARSGGVTCNPVTMSFTISGITNPGTSGTTSVFQVFTRTNTGVNIDTNTNVAGVQIDPSGGALTSVSATPANAAAGATTPYTLAFTTTTAWPADGKLIIRVPAGFVLPTVLSNVPVSDAAGCTSGTFSGQVTATGTITVTRSGGTSCPAGPASLRIDQFTNPTVSGATGAIQLATQSANSVDLNTGSAAALIQDAAATVTSVTPTPALAGAASTHAFAFGIPTATPWPTGGKVVLTFPAGYALGSTPTATLAGSDASCDSGPEAGTLAAARTSDLVLSITRVGDGTGACVGPTTVTITSGVTNPAASSSSLGPYGVSVRRSDGLSFASGSFNGVVINPSGHSATLAPVTIAPINAVAGQVTSYTFLYTLPASPAWPADGRLLITFPTGYALPTPGTSIPVTDPSGCSGALGTLTASVASASQLLVTRSASGTCASSTVGFTLGLIQNPALTGAQTVNLMLRDAAGIDLLAGSDATPALTAGALDVVVTPTSSIAGAVTSYTFQFTTSNPIPADGRFVVDFPATPAYAVGTVGVSLFSGCDGLFAATKSGDIVTVTRSAGTSCAPGAKSFTISGITNPATSGTTSVFKAYTRNNAGTDIDNNELVSGVAIQPSGGALTGVGVTPASSVTGASTSYVIAFTTATAWPGDGLLVIDLPAGVTTSGVTVLDRTGCTSGSMSPSGTDPITITRVGGSSCAPGAMSITIGALTNPATEGLTGSFLLATRTNGGVDIDTAAGVASITMNTLPVSSITPGDSHAGAASTYAFLVTIPDQNAWATNGKIVVTFPSGYTVGASPAASFTSADTSCDAGAEQGTLGATSTGNTVTVTRNGDGTGACDGALTLTITSGITNPGASGATGTFSLVERNAAGQGIATGSLVGPPLVPSGDPNTLSPVAIAPIDDVAGAVTSYTFSLDLPASPAWPADGRLAVTFPTGYSLPSSGSSIPVTAPSGCSGALGTLTASVASSNQILVTRSAAGTCASSTVAFTLGLIQNPAVTGAQTINLMARNAAGVDLLAGSDATPALTAGALDVVVTPVTNVAGAATSYGYQFTTTNPIPADGRLVVDFPSGYTLGVVGVTGFNGCDGLFAATKTAGEIVTVARSGGASCAAGVKSFTITGVTNPGSAATTGVFKGFTRNNVGSDIDKNELVSGVEIQPSGGSLTGIAVTPASGVAGAATNYVLGFTTATAWPGDGKLLIDLPTGVSTSGVTVLDRTGCVTGSMTPSGTDPITLTRVGGTSCSPGAMTVTIGSLTNPTNEGLTGAFLLATQASNGVDLDTGSGLASIQMAALTLTSITPTPALAGLASSYDLGVTVPASTPWPTGGKLSLTVPNTYGVAGSLTASFTSSDASCDSSGERGTLGATAVGNVVTITRSGDGTGACVGAYTLTLSAGLTNPAQSGATGAFSLVQRNAANQGMASGSNAGTTINPSGHPTTLSSVDLVPVSDIVGATTNYAVSLGIPASPAWPMNGKLLVTFPAGTTLPATGSSVPVSAVSGCDGTLTGTVASATTVLVTRAGGTNCASATLAFILGSITNRPFAGAPASSVMLRDAANVDMLTGTDGSPTALLAAPFTAVSVTPASSITGAATNYAIALTSTLSWPADGRFLFTFPSSPATYTLGTVGVVSVDGCDGLYSATKVGLTVTVARSGGTACAAGLKTITLSGATNPSTAGTTGTFSATTTTNTASEEINKNAAVTGIAIDAASQLTGMSATPVNNAAGAGPTSYTIAFTTLSTLPANGNILVRFPAGYTVDPTSAVVSSTGCDGALTAAPSGLDIVLSRTGGTACSAGGKSVTLSGLTNPGVSGQTGTILVKTRTSTNVDLDSGTVTATLVPGTLTGVTVVPTDARPGQASAQTIAFTAVNSVPANGKFFVTFPTGYALPGPLAATFTSSHTSCDTPTERGTLSATSSGLTVTVARNNDPGAAACIGAMSLEISTGVTNPSADGVTGAFTVSTANGDASPRAIDTHTTATSTIDAPDLTSVSIAATPAGVGQTASYLVTFTLAAGGPGGLGWAKDGKLAIAFPSDTTFGAVAASGTATGCTLGSPLAAEVVGTTVTVTRPGTAGGATDCAAAAGPIAITLTNVRNPSVSGANVITPTLLTKSATGIDRDEGSAGVTIDPGAISPVTITPTNAAKSATTSYVFGLTTTNTWPADGKLEIVFPGAYTITNALSADVSGSGVSGTFGATKSGTTVTVTRSGGTAWAGGAKTVTLAGITNPSTSGVTAAFTVRTTDNALRVIDTANPAGVTITSTLDSVSITPDSFQVGAVTKYTFVFIPNSAWTAGNLLVTFPAGYDATGATMVTSSPTPAACLGAPPTVASATATAVVISKTSATDCAGGSRTVALSGIRNPGTAGATGAIVLATRDASNNVLDQGQVSSINLAASGVLSGIQLVPTSSAAGAVTSYRVDFTTATSWPVGGTLRIGFPTAYALATAAVASSPAPTGCDGVFAVSSIAAPLVTITRTGGTACAAGAKSLTLSGITNPTTIGPAGAFTLRTRSDTGVDLDVATTDANIVTITAAALTGLAIVPTSLTISHPSSYTFNFNSANPWPADGKLTATFPSGFSFGTLGATMSGTGASGTFTATRSGNVVTVARAAGSEWTSGAKTLTLSGLTNPASTGPAGVFTVALKRADDVTLETASSASNAVTIAPGTITPFSIAPLSYIGGATTDYLADFTTETSWPSDGRLVLTFPADFTFGTLVADVTGDDASGTFSVSRVGQVVTVLRSGGTAWPAGAMTLTLEDVANPEVAGTTGAFALKTTTAGGLDIDSGAASGIVIVDPTPPSAVGAISSTPFPASPAWSAATTGAVSWLAATDTGGSPTLSYQTTLDSANVPSTLTGATTALTATLGSASAPLAAGAHTFRVRAIDSSGNAGPVSSYAFQIDTVAPTAALLASTTHAEAPSGCSGDATGTFTWSGASDATSGLASMPYAFKVDSGTATETDQLTANVAGLTEGTHTLTLTTKDAAGNAATADTYSFKVDLAPATVTVTAPGSARAAFTVSWTGDGGTCATVSSYTVQARKAGGTYATISDGTATSVTFTPTAGDGTYEFQAKVKDALNRESAFPATPSMTVFDTTAPSQVLGVVATTLNAGQVRVAWTAATDPAGSGIDSYTLERATTLTGAFAALTSGVATTSYVDPASSTADDTTYCYRVKAVDEAGNAGVVSAPACALADDAVTVVIPPATTITALGTALGVTVPDDIRATDQNGDGTLDTISGAGTGIQQVRTVFSLDNHEAFLLAVTNQRPVAIFIPDLNQVVAVVPTTGTVTGTTTVADETIVTVSTTKESGWIELEVVNPFPNQQIARVLASDGRQIPASQVQTSGGKIFILDDPVTTYQIVYATPGGEPQEGPVADEGKAFPTWVIYVFMAAFLAIIVAVAVGVVRSRKNDGAGDAGDRKPGNGEF